MLGLRQFGRDLPQAPRLAQQIGVLFRAVTLVAFNASASRRRGVVPGAAQLRYRHRLLKLRHDAKHLAHRFHHRITDGHECVGLAQGNKLHAPVPEHL